MELILFIFLPIFYILNDRLIYCDCFLKYLCMYVLNTDGIINYYTIDNQMTDRDRNLTTLSIQSPWSSR